MQLDRLCRPPFEDAVSVVYLHRVASAFIFVLVVIVIIIVVAVVHFSDDPGINAPVPVFQKHAVSELQVASWGGGGGGG